MLRLSALALLATLAGCQWEGRPDGAEAVRTAGDGFYESEYQPQVTPLGGSATDRDVAVPLDATAPAGGAPVDLSQPAPTGGTADATSEVEEALTPGTEQ